MISLERPLSGSTAFSLLAALGISIQALAGCAADEVPEADTDGDGIPDSQDPDVDGDGIPNDQDPDYVPPQTGGASGTGGGLNVGTGGTGTGGGTVTECTTDPVTGEEICVCVKLVTWGALGAYGAVPGMDGQDAIGAWLNENSTGDADYTATKPVINADTLAPYNVIIIQDISAWAPFTAEEKAAFEAWVRAGGGVLTLNGYSANGNEMTNVNDLLAFSGMSYVASSDTSNEADRTALLGECEYCYGSSVPQAGWTAHPIGLNIEKVGAFHGRAVTPGAAEVVAQEGTDVLGAAASYDSGRVFFFHDEWVTYNSQWTGSGIEDDCRDTTLHPMTCSMEHPVLTYTLPQFWYNSLKWLSNKECFDITDPTIVR